jgi:hypothetical protein
MLTVGLLLNTAAVSAQSAPLNACDLNADGAVNVADTVTGVNMILGPPSGCTANIIGANVCNVVMLQRVVNAALGSACVTGLAHSVDLTWVASTSADVAGYLVHRGNVLGSYTPITPTRVTGLTYTDSTVQAGQTYYYVVTAVDSSNNASTYSNVATAIVPYP